MPTIAITKESVKLSQAKLYSITLKMRYLDGDAELINQSFPCRYRTGEDVKNIINKLKNDMQKVIDNYKAEQVIFNSSQLNTAVETIKSGLIA